MYAAKMSNMMILTILFLNTNARRVNKMIAISPMKGAHIKLIKPPIPSPAKSALIANPKEMNTHNNKINTPCPISMSI